MCFSADTWPSDTTGFGLRLRSPNSSFRSFSLIIIIHGCPNTRRRNKRCIDAVNATAAIAITASNAKELGLGLLVRGALNVNDIDRIIYRLFISTFSVCRRSDPRNPVSSVLFAPPSTSMSSLISGLVPSLTIAEALSRRDSLCRSRVILTVENPTSVQVALAIWQIRRYTYIYRDHASLFLLWFRSIVS